ncbi:MAG: cupin domain-containing protein [Fretibacterium sp.]|nr:cupin domain-containing protein [Fretibacterium sp.]
MREEAGVVFSVAGGNRPVPGCTVSKALYQGSGNEVLCFSLAEGTDISAELYPNHKLIIMTKGEMNVFTGNKRSWALTENDCLITPVNVPLGVRAGSEAIYVEINLRRDCVLNTAIKEGEVFKLAELVPYQDGRIVNMDILSNKALKFVVMSFDAGTGLSEHAAPGEALIFALDGQGVVGYEGKEHTLKAGENFKFAKGGVHYVKAAERFKMALLLTLE